MIRGEHAAMIRRLALLAAALSATAEAPPPALAPYVHGSAFDPGDYGWLRGMFAGANPTEVEQFVSVSRWLERCRKMGLANVRAALLEAGIAAPAVHDGMYGEELCGAVSTAFPQGDMGKDWTTFQTKLASARRISMTLIWAAGLAQDVADGDGPLADRINARPMTDQVLRLSLAWNAGERKGAPPVDAMEAGIIRALTWSAIRTRDHANTAWMKTVVAEQGWPTIAMVGKAASANAWLLVQHADDDPVFQLKMLHLMEPLAAKGEVSPQNYALLYDRVMLQTAGTQRYGTQMTCATGDWQPFPIEDAARVEGYRRSAGLNTMAQNAARIRKEYGPCPPTQPAH